MTHTETVATLFVISVMCLVILAVVDNWTRGKHRAVTFTVDVFLCLTGAIAALGLSLWSLQ